MDVTTAMVGMLILWSDVTILTQPDKQRLPPAPIPQNLTFNHDAAGWMPDVAPGVLRELPTTEEQDIVVTTVRLIQGPDAGERDLYDTNLFTDYEQRLFTRVVALAEKHGKPVNLVVVPSTNAFDAVAQAALRLDAAEIVAGLSAKMSA